MTLTHDYKIADITVRFSASEPYHDMMAGYRIADATAVDAELSAEHVRDISIVGEVVTRSDAVIHTREGEIDRIYYLVDSTVCAGIWWTTNRLKQGVFVRENILIDGMDNCEFSYLMLGMLFNYRLTYFGGMTMHGSAISYGDKAIIFTAPSGVGKSTQAMLWREQFGDKVHFINDDKPSLRLIDGKIYCYGTPFSGKNHINENVRIPLSAIVNVRRADADSMERMTRRDSLVVLLEETSRTANSREINDKNMTFISRIIADIPMYRLYCTPTLQAVKVAYDALRGEL